MADPIRSLLAEMADELNNNRRCLLGDGGIVHPLAERARAALAAAPPAPDHLRGGTEMVGDGEREEMAQWLEDLGEDYDDLYRPTSDLVVPRLTRAAALLRQPAPAPVPVAERPWEREGWCDAEGRCWLLVPNQSWPCVYLMRKDIVIAVADEDAHCLPHWAIPQPPQGGEVEA